jgi:hypothetical protein
MEDGGAEATAVGPSSTSAAATNTSTAPTSSQPSSQTANPARTSNADASQARLSLPPATAGATAHEGFVAPSDYLRRARAASKPMPPNSKVPETAVDRDQQRGLVGFQLRVSIAFSFCSFAVPLSMRLTLRASTAKHTALSPRAHSLRCASFELPAYYAGYHAAGEEELEHTQPER